MAIELVVFDMAGTTVRDDAAVQNAFRDALAAVGVEVKPGEAQQVMGLPKPEAIRKLITKSSRADALLPRLESIHADFVTRMRRYYETSPRVGEVAGAGETFAALRQAGIRIALNTGFSRDIVDVLLRRLGWTEGGTVDAVVTSDEVPRGRPHPDMIRLLMSRLGIRDAARVAKVGDTPVDLQEGTEAGCGLVVGVSTGAHTHEQLAAYPHTHLIGSVAEVPHLLGLSVEPTNAAAS